MYVTDPLDLLAAAADRGRHLRSAAAAERLRGPSATRRVLAAALRMAADRIDRRPFLPRPAGQH